LKNGIQVLEKAGSPDSKPNPDVIPGYCCERTLRLFGPLLQRDTNAQSGT
jgi:hypothetical protein